ncbi:hypothetical protein [Actinophytocola sp.]|uniref:hypothetical protein n=1 Tax=Actinophytocola sp. TaxID=1872138 RepID=UPI002ED12AC3
MNLLIWQVLVVVATTLVLFLRWQLCCRHHRGPERRVVAVRREQQRPPMPEITRVGVRFMATRTVALSTLPMPIKGTIEPARYVGTDVAPSPYPSDIRFAPPDIALMRRVLEGLRALPDSPRETPPQG